MVSAFKAVEEVYTDDEFWREMEVELAARLGAVTRRLVLEGARAAESVGVIVDFDAIHEEALAVTRTTESMYWGKMTQTTREGLRQAFLTYQEEGLGKRGFLDLLDTLEPIVKRDTATRAIDTIQAMAGADRADVIRALRRVPGVDSAKRAESVLQAYDVMQDKRLAILLDSIEPLFDRGRAKRIAITESTRLFGEGNRLAALRDPYAGGLEWQTAADERVCEICGPRHMLIYPKESLPTHPAHVNCRCGLIPVSWRFIRQHPSKWQGGEIPPGVPAEAEAEAMLVPA